MQKISIEKKISIEEAGRNERYNFIEEVAKEYYFNRIAMAHHINDQAETLLMRLIRGTGIKGVSGIRASRDNLFIRPFLCLEKKEIINYCNQYQLEYRTDATNFQKDYTLNKIRLDIMPMINEMNPKAENHFSDFTKIALEYEEFLEDYIDEIQDEIYIKDGFKVYINRQNWLDEKSIVQKEILRRAIYEFKGTLKEIEYNHIIAFYNLLKSDKTVWNLHLPQNIQIVRRYAQIFITDQDGKKNQIRQSIEIIPNKTWVITSKQLIIDIRLMNQKQFKDEIGNVFEEIKNHSEKYFDYDKIKGVLCLRSRQEGDFFYPVGIFGKKTIKKYFIDKKIDRDVRNDIPLLADGSEILWIMGYGINKRFLADSNTKNILKVNVTLC